MSELKYWLWLSTRRGLGPVGVLTVLDHFVTPERAYYAGQEEYELLPLPPAGGCWTRVWRCPTKFWRTATG